MRGWGLRRLRGAVGGCTARAATPTSAYIDAGWSRVLVDASRAPADCVVQLEARRPHVESLRMDMELRAKGLEFSPSLS